MRLAESWLCTCSTFLAEGAALVKDAVVFKGALVVEAVLVEVVAVVEHAAVVPCGLASLGMTGSSVARHNFCQTEKVELPSRS